MSFRFHLLLSTAILPLVLANSPRAESKSKRYSHEKVLEATNETAGRRYLDRYLFVQLKQSGEVDWEERTDQHKRHWASIGPDEAAAVQRRLGIIEPTASLSALDRIRSIQIQQSGSPFG
jgi:hypothetical protein